jgi:hypothetical protein
MVHFTYPHTHPAPHSTRMHSDIDARAATRCPRRSHCETPAASGACDQESSSIWSHAVHVQAGAVQERRELSQARTTRCGRALARMRMLLRLTSHEVCVCVSVCVVECWRRRQRGRPRNAMRCCCQRSGLQLARLVRLLDGRSLGLFCQVDGRLLLPSRLEHAVLKRAYTRKRVTHGGCIVGVCV